MLYIGETGRCLRTRFGEHRRSVISNEANEPVARQSLCFRYENLSPLSHSDINDGRKRHEMRLIFKLDTVHPLAINERFSYI